MRLGIGSLELEFGVLLCCGVVVVAAVDCAVLPRENETPNEQRRERTRAQRSAAHRSIERACVCLLPPFTTAHRTSGRNPDACVRVAAELDVLW
ncbi:hypothetical protein GQ42DRAFT_5117 [Ramicandelaber brevisporus]|nr:hypothetical protein GQ42DRAFT_5117 [Ramicandelaber brevisporus]